jgi:hypothetical protein
VSHRHPGKLLQTGGYPSPELSHRAELVTRSLEAGARDEIDRLFREIDSPPPVTRWDPPDDAFEDGPLRFLLGLWRRRSAGGRLPLSRDIDAVELWPALGYVMLLEPIDDGADFRYRVYGTIIAEHSGIEMTGKQVWDVPAPLVAVYFLATYRAVYRARRPLYAHHTTHHDIQIADWSRIILPFADDHGRVDRLLVGNLPSLRSL